MPDFGLLQAPNFGASALAGFQAGQAMGRQKLVQSALQGVDLTRPETITPLLKVDPEHGIALLGASTKMLENERAIAARQAATDYLSARFAPKPASAATPSVSTDGTTVAAAAPAAPDTSNAEHALMTADPEGYLKLREHVDKMDADQRARLVEAQDAIHDIAAATSDLPYEQRKAYIAAHASDLSAHFVTPEQIAGFDPTDQNIQTAINSAVGVKGVIDRAEKRVVHAEQARHNRATEGVAGENLKLSKAREARVTKWGPQSLVVAGAVPDTTDDLNY